MLLLPVIAYALSVCATFAAFGEDAYEVGHGFIEGGEETAIAIGNLIAHPDQSARAMKHLAQHPKDTFSNAKQAVTAACTGHLAECSGKAGFVALTSLVAPKAELAALENLATAGKIGEVAVDTSHASQLGGLPGVDAGGKLRNGTLDPLEGRNANPSNGSRTPGMTKTPVQLHDLPSGEVAAQTQPATGAAVRRVLLPSTASAALKSRFPAAPAKNAVYQE